VTAQAQLSLSSIRPSLLILYVDIRQVSENPEYLEKPDNYNNHDHNVEDGFDFVIHRDVSVDKPQNKTCDDQYD
jgi:hypothetical protein